MARQAVTLDADAQEDDESAVPTITAHETSPERLVFTEAENDEGWIATDTTVEVSDRL